MSRTYSVRHLGQTLRTYRGFDYDFMEWECPTCRGAGCVECSDRGTKKPVDWVAVILVEGSAEVVAIDGPDSVPELQRLISEEGWAPGAVRLLGVYQRV